MLRAARAELKIWNRESAGITDLEKVGLKGSPTVVSKVFAPKPKAVKAKMVEGATADAQVAAILDTLASQHTGLYSSITAA